MIERAKATARDSKFLSRTRVQRFAVAPKSIHLVLVLLIGWSAATRHVAAHSTSFQASVMRATNPHQQMCSLLFQTPACTQPAIYRKPAVARPSPSSCSQDTCSLSGPSPVQAARQVLPDVTKGSSRRKVRTAAQLASSTTSTSTQQWWKKQSELWVDVHTEEEFYHEISTGNRLVFVGEF